MHVCVCRCREWFGTQPAEPVGMKYGVMIVWDANVLCVCSMDNTSFAD